LWHNSGVTDPVAVFLLVVAGLLVVGALGEQVFARTGVPAVIWLILLGVCVRVAGIVPGPVIAGLAPFFAGLALVLILFDAGRHLTGEADAELPAADRRRALLLALLTAALTLPLAALLSMALYGLGVLPVWSWTHALMLGALLGAGAGEVFLPSLRAAGLPAATTALLRRESAVTKAIAVAGTVLFLDLLSPRVAVGGAGLALAAGFGFALAFGSVAGVFWIAALQRLAGNARSYLYTLAAMIALYVLSESAGGSGPLSVLVFGATLGNAEPLLALLRRRGDPGDAHAAAVVHTALRDHDATIQFVRTLVFMMVGLMLAPPWGPLVMGVALGFLLLVVRLLVVRFVFAGQAHEERAPVGLCAPRGMATVALATLSLAHAVPGSDAMLTLVFSAVTTSVLLFTLGVRGLGRPRDAAPAGLTTTVRDPPVPPAAPAPSAPTTTRFDPPPPELRPRVEARRPAPAEPRPITLVDVVAESLADELRAEPQRAPSLLGEAREPSGLHRVDGPRQATPHDANLDEGLRETTPDARHPGAHEPRHGAPARDGLHPAAPTPDAHAHDGLPRATPDALHPGGSALDLALQRTLPDDGLRRGTPRPEATASPRTPVPQFGAASPRTPAPRDESRPAVQTPDVYMLTLPTIDAARLHGEDPLSTAMQRALAKRPDEVTQVRRRPTLEVEVPPPTFAEFPGSSEEDAASVLAALSLHDEDDPAAGRKP
jgi:cell volume regulation protein A